MQLHHLTQEHGRLAMMDLVCDFEQAGLGLIFPPFYVFANPWVRMIQTNYPCTSSAITFVHPPRFLAAVWRLLTPLFDPDTVEKMRVADPDQRYEVPSTARPLPPVATIAKPL